MREVSERDYGIDCYIELASKNGNITGKLISVQLKAVNRIKWKGARHRQEAASPEIKTSTANYWLQLPVPVFLLVADLEARDIFYVPVERQLRSRYEKLDLQDTVTLRLPRVLSLRSKTGVALFNALYERERLHEQFSFHVTNLLSQVSSFSQFISMNQNRDSFMPVDTENHLQFRAMYRSCELVSLYTDGQWPVEALDELYAKDRAFWKSEEILLHEETLDRALQQLEKVFPVVVRKALQLVTEQQMSYWRERDPIFFDLCINGDLEATLRELERGGCR